MLGTSAALQLRQDQVTRSLTVEGSTIHMAFTATEPRLLRAAVGTFCDLLRLAITVLENFE